MAAPAFPPRGATAYPTGPGAFSANLPAAQQQSARLAQLAKNNPRLLESLPNIPVDLLPQGKRVTLP